MAILNCPACGNPTAVFREGYCEPCQQYRQNALDQHNVEYDAWQRKTDKEREAAIKWALW